MLYFKVALLHILHALTIIIRINYAQIDGSNTKPNPNPSHILNSLLLVINITQYVNV